MGTEELTREAIPVILKKQSLVALTLLLREGNPLRLAADRNQTRTNKKANKQC